MLKSKRTSEPEAGKDIFKGFSCAQEGGEVDLSLESTCVWTLKSWRNFDSRRGCGCNCLAYSQNHKRDFLNMGTWKQAFRPMIMMDCTVACASSLKFSSDLGLAGILINCRYQILSKVLTLISIFPGVIQRVML